MADMILSATNLGMSQHIAILHCIETETYGFTYFYHTGFCNKSSSTEHKVTNTTLIRAKFYSLGEFNFFKCATLQKEMKVYV